VAEGHMETGLGALFKFPEFLGSILFLQFIIAVTLIY
jgi:hypothetical protein